MPPSSRANRWKNSQPDIAASRHVPGRPAARKTWSIPKCFDRAASLAELGHSSGDFALRAYSSFSFKPNRDSHRRCGLPPGPECLIFEIVEIGLVVGQLFVDLGPIAGDRSSLNRDIDFGLPQLLPPLVLHLSQASPFLGDQLVLVENAGDGGGPDGDRADIARLFLRATAAARPARGLSGRRLRR